VSIPCVLLSSLPYAPILVTPPCEWFAQEEDRIDVCIVCVARGSVVVSTTVPCGCAGTGSNAEVHVNPRHPMLVVGGREEAGAVPPLITSWTGCRLAGKTSSTSATAVGDTCIVRDLQCQSEIPAGASTHVWGNRRVMQLRGIYHIKSPTRDAWVVRCHPLVYVGPDQETLISDTTPGCTVWHLDATQSVYLNIADVVRPVQCVHLCTSSGPQDPYKHNTVHS
jgi:hypothetical protein